MGALGQYLRSAREARGIDLRDAAQQTRISIAYLKALEAEDFSRIPGSVFVRGFLKNYGKFLHLDESEVMKKYAESIPIPPVPPAPALTPEKTQAPAVAAEEKTTTRAPLDLFIWAAGIMIVLGILLFAVLPERHRDVHHAPAISPPVSLEPVPVPVQKPEKIYLEVIALDNTWLLVRTDNGPQKKAVLKKGESLIWSADERFLLSYGSAGAIKLQLNGKELTVNEPKNAVVRDLSVTASGIMGRTAPPEAANTAPRPRKPAVALQTGPSRTAPAAEPQRKKETPPQVRQVPSPAAEPQRKPEVPAEVQQSPAPAAELPQPKPETPTESQQSPAPAPAQPPAQ